MIGIRRISVIAAAAIAAGAFALAGCGDEQDSEGTELRLAHVLQQDHPVHKAMVRMAELVEEKTDGELTIHLRHSEQLGAEKELIEKCQAGEIHMTKVSTNALEANVRDLGVYALPFLFRDEAHYFKVIEGPVGQELLEKLSAAGLKGLVYYDAGARSVYANRPINGVGDLKGLKIRVQQSETMRDAMRALGAQPVAIPFGAQLTQALSKGQRVEAAENNPPSYWTEGHYKYCPYYFLDKHTRAPDVLVMNLDVWNQLGEAKRTALMEAAGQSAQYQKKLWKEDVRQRYKHLEREGVRITYEVDTAPLVEAVQSVYDGLSGHRRALVEKIRAVQ